MKTEQEIDHLFQQSMEALDNISPQTPSPFLYTRIMGKMQQSEIPTWSVRLSLASLIVLAILNLGYIFGSGTALESANNGSGIQAFSEEYHLTVNQNL